MKGTRSNTLVRRALRIEQDPEHPLFLFTLTAEELIRIADISRLSRDEDGKLIGYQRPEVRRHIENIVEYLDSGDVVFPNSIILALSSDVFFRQSRGPKVDDGLAVIGTIELPMPKNGAPKPAWIVDGQQRTMALANSSRRDFPVPVNAFIADDVEIQRDQFLRINNTKPLPRGLIDELLPEVSTLLPANLAARKAPAALCDMLNRDPESPFCGLIRQASTKGGKRGQAVVADTVLIKMLQESFSSPSGVLFPFRNIATGVTDFVGVRSILIAYWSAVRDTFPDAWGLPPEKSRLMHGVGIRSMGRLMDRVMSSVAADSIRAGVQARKELERIGPFCHWTSGNWEDLGGIRWNELQNVPSHIRMLANHLIRAYIGARRPG